MCHPFCFAHSILLPKHEFKLRYLMYILPCLVSFIPLPCSLDQKNNWQKNSKKILHHWELMGPICLSSPSLQNPLFFFLKHVLNMQAQICVWNHYTNHAAKVIKLSGAWISVVLGCLPLATWGLALSCCKMLMLECSIMDGTMWGSRISLVNHVIKYHN